MGVVPFMCLLHNMLFSVLRSGPVVYLGGGGGGGGELRQVLEPPVLLNNR